MLNRYDYEATIAYAKKEGETRGMEKGVAIGEARGLERAARSMLGEGMEPALVENSL
jgi:hypothetical protein